MRAALYDNAFDDVLLKDKTELSLARKHGQGCSMRSTLYSKDG